MGPVGDFLDGIFFLRISIEIFHDFMISSNHHHSKGSTDLNPPACQCLMLPFLSTIMFQWKITLIERKLILETSHFRLNYCWWLKSCTTWDVWNLINNGINYLSTGAGFLPSTVWLWEEEYTWRFDLQESPYLQPIEMKYVSLNLRVLKQTPKERWYIGTIMQHINVQV